MIGSENALEMLALLGRTDLATLRKLCHEPLTKAMWSELSQSSSVNAAGAWLEMAPAEANRIQREWEARDRESYILALETAYLALKERLLAAPAAWERSFLRLARRRAIMLSRNDPLALPKLVAELGSLDAISAAGKPMIDYIIGVENLSLGETQAALARFEKVAGAPGIDDELRAHALNAAAIAQRLLGRAEAALEGYRSALALWRTFADAHNQAVVLKNMGIIHYHLHQYGAALDVLAEAEVLFAGAGEMGWLAEVNNERGVIYRNLGRWDEALACFAEFVRVRTAEGADDHVAIGLLNIAEVTFFQGDVAAAADHCQRAADLMQTERYRIDLLILQGLILEAKGALDDAVAVYDEALVVAERIDRYEIKPELYYRLAMATWAGKDVAGAAAFFEEALALLATLQQLPSRDDIRISLLGKWQQIYESYIQLLLQEGNAARAFQVSEQARARAFSARVLGEEADTTVAAVQSYLGPGDQFVSFFTTGVRQQEIPFLQNLARDHFLTKLLLVEPAIYRFAISAEDFACLNCELDPNTLTPNSVTRREPNRFFNPMVGQVLQRRLLPDLQLSPTRPLIICPHGPVHEIPFEVLLTRQNPEVVYTPSATIYCGAPKRVRASSGGLAVAFAQSTRSSDVLQFAAPEAHIMAAFIAGTELLLADLTCERVAAAAQKKRWLHFACHGWFTEDAPMESYIELSLTERLTALEIAQNWALAAELVVLSACRSGVSQILRGDEPMGLVRAFMFAGARAVLMTRWPVADAASYLFMRHFYERLGQGERVAVAVVKARQFLAGLGHKAARRLLLGRLADFDEGQLPPHELPFADAQYWGAFSLVTSQRGRDQSSGIKYPA